MNEESKSIRKRKAIDHPRVKEINEQLMPPSPLIVPRDELQPKVGYISEIHKEPYTATNFIEIPKINKPEITLSLGSKLLLKRKQN